MFGAVPSPSFRFPVRISHETIVHSKRGNLWPTSTAYWKAETLLANKGSSSQGYGFSSGHVWMWELDYKESWASKNWCFWTVALEKTLESPLECKEIQPVHPKGNQSWVFIGGTVVEAETPIIWPPDAKSWLIGKDPDAWKDWGQEEKGTIEDEMVGWHHQLNGHGFGWTLGVSDGQEGLACCGSWGRKESDMTERLNWTEECCWHRFLNHIVPSSENPSEKLLFFMSRKRSFFLSSCMYFVTLFSFCVDC